MDAKSEFIEPTAEVEAQAKAIVERSQTNRVSLSGVPGYPLAPVHEARTVMLATCMALIESHGSIPINIVSP